MVKPVLFEWVTGETFNGKVVDYGDVFEVPLRVPVIWITVVGGNIHQRAYHCQPGDRFAAYPIGVMKL